MGICCHVANLNKPKTNQNLIFFAANHVYRKKHCGDVCNDVILKPQLLEVVATCLSVVGNVTYCFVKDLTDFTALREF